MKNQENILAEESCTSNNEDNVEPVPLIRTEGITPAERYLKRLCDPYLLITLELSGCFS